MIPKIIHQIHLGDSSLSPEELEWKDSWSKYNPSWQYIFWDEEMINDLDFDSKKFLEFCSCYAMKSDIIRYELLYKFGGLYVDTDFECLRNFDSFVDCKDFMFCRQVHDGKGDFPRIPEVCNAFIASSPGHIFLQKLIDGLKDRLELGYRYPFSTGPLYMHDIIGPENALDPEYVYPFMWWEDKPKKGEDLRSKYPNSYAVHHWQGSWV